MSVYYHKLRLPPESLSLAGKLQSLRSRQFFVSKIKLRNEK
jgi:hypothetical protein